MIKKSLRLTPVILSVLALSVSSAHAAKNKSKSEEKRFGGSVSVNNHGNRFTGRGQAVISTYAKDILSKGDDVHASFLRTQNNLWYGSLGYSTLVGNSGLRANFDYSCLNYDFAYNTSGNGSQDFDGTADIARTGLSYPIINSDKTKVTVSGDYMRKWFSDKTTLITPYQGSKNSDVIPLTLGFSKRDNFLGGGATYGYIKWTHGVMDLSRNTKESDTSKVDGNFDKLNFDLARLQALPVNNLMLFARGFGQQAADNLDSSEKMTIGGANAVRAYPLGEGFGDNTLVTQAEIRYAINKNVIPFAFYDWGRSKTNYNSWSSINIVERPNHRTIAGAGLGVRTNYKDFMLDGSIAWRTVGNFAISDKKAKTPTMWVNFGYSF